MADKTICGADRVADPPPTLAQRPDAGSGAVSTRCIAGKPFLIRRRTAA